MGTDFDDVPREKNFLGRLLARLMGEDFNDVLEEGW